MLTLPAPIESTLSGAVSNAILTSLGPTAALPVVGSALSNPAFINAQVKQLIDQFDAAYDAGAYTAMPISGGSRITMNQTAHAMGQEIVAMTGIPGQNLFKLSTVPGQNNRAYAFLTLDTYYRLQFDVDIAGLTFTLDDAPLNQAMSQVATSNPGINLGLPAPKSFPAPSTPIAIVVGANLGGGFEADGTLGGQDTAIHDHSLAVQVGGTVPTLSNETYLLTMIEASLGSPTISPSGVTGINSTAVLTGNAHLDLDLHLSVSKDYGLTVGSRLVADWTADHLTLSPANQAPPASQFGTLPYVEFRDVTFDLGSLAGAIGNVLQSIQNVTDNPVLHDVLAFYNLKMPIIGESLRDIAVAKGLITPAANDALSILTFINSLHIPGQQTGGVIDVGTFQIADPRQGGIPLITQSQLSTETPGQVSSFLHNAFGVDLPSADQQYGLHFRFLENPLGVLFPMLLGQDSTLITFSTPPIDISFTMDDIFSMFGAFDLFSAYPGVSLDGQFNAHLELSAGFDTVGLTRSSNDKPSDKTDVNFGMYIDTAHTGATISSGMVLSVNAGAFSISGGVLGNVVLIPNGHLDPADPNKVRAGFLLDSGVGLVQPYGSLSFQATVHPAGASDITLVDTTLFAFDLPGPFETEIELVGSDHTIHIDKSDKTETIDVIETHLDMTTGRPVFGNQVNAYDLAIQVITGTKRTYYKLARYVKNGQGVYTLNASLSSVNLIFVGGALTGPNNGVIQKTIYIDDLDGDGSGGIVNAVILGTNGTDTLEYFGRGSSILIGGAGNKDVLRSRPAQGVGAQSALMTDYLTSANPLPQLFDLSADEQAAITAAGTAPPTPPPAQPAVGFASAAAPSALVNTQQVVVGSGAADFVVVSGGDQVLGMSTNSTIIIPAGAETLGETHIELLAGDPSVSGSITGGHVHVVLEDAVGTWQFLELTNSTFTGWGNGTSPGFTLHLHNLTGIFTVDTAPNERLNVENTPTGVSKVIVKNPSFMQNQLYLVAATATFEVDGNWSIYAGQRDHLDGTVERLEHLGGLPITMVVVSDGPVVNHFVFDGDADPAGAHYQITGFDDLGGALTGTAENYQVVVNQTVGLTVYRAARTDDDTYIYLPGGSVDANLATSQALGNFFFDGKARLAGVNPTAVNTYSLTLPSTDIHIDPVGPNQTRASGYNTFNFLGSMPQDVHTINKANGTATVTIDGSELHGQLNFHDLDGSAGLLDSDLQKVFAAATFAHPVDPHLSRAFGSASIFLNKVRPDLNVNLTGTSTYASIILYQDANVYAPPNSLPWLNRFLSNVENNVRNLIGAAQSNFWTFTAPQTHVTIGNGSLADIQGNVSATNADLTIDDRQNTSANIIQMTTTGFTGWATPSGSHPSVTIGTIYGAFTFNASPVDRFNIDGTPKHWWETNLAAAESRWTLGYKISVDGSNDTRRISTYDDLLFFSTDRTTIQNFVTSGTPSDVYIIGKDMMPMSIIGNFNLTAGRRLLADGNVQASGLVDNIIRPPTGGNYARQQPIQYSYTGQGTSTAIWDASGDVLTQSFLASMKASIFYGLFESPRNPGLGTLYYLDGDYVSYQYENSSQFPLSYHADVRGQLVYGANTELSFFAPQIPIGATFTPVFDNPLTAPVHFYANQASALTAAENLTIYTTRGLVDVHGERGVTRVLLAPPNGNNPPLTGDTAAGNGGLSSSQSVMPYLPLDNYLTHSVLGDVSVTDASVEIEADNFATPVAPPVIPPVHLTQTELTGITGGIIHLSNLANFSTLGNSDKPPDSGNINSGLYIDLASYGTINTTVDDTPPGVITALDAHASTPHPVTVLGTTGGLVFAGHLNGPTITIGDGSLDRIHGALYFRSPVGDVAKTFDDHLGEARTVTFTGLAVNQTEVGPGYTGKMTGLAPASIYFYDFSKHVDILGSAGSTFNMADGANQSPPWRLFAGLQTTVNMLPIVPGPTSPQQASGTPTMEIYGAQNVYVRIDNAVQFANNNFPIKVFKDPTRPNDPINVTVDFSTTTTTTTPLSTLILDRFSATQGTVSAFGPAVSTQPQILFPSDVTHLTVKSGRTGSLITTVFVSNTAAAATVLDPGQATVNVNLTSGPLTILQGTTSTARVTISPAGNMQPIAGAVTILANDPTRPRLPVQLNDGSDSTGRTATFSSAGATTLLSGLAPGPIGFSGSLTDVTISGGTGSNTLGETDGTNTWELSSANGGKLNSIFTYSRFANLRGGSGADDFTFKPGGTVAGDIDAGDGFDTAHYFPGVLNGSETINLAAGILPKVSGHALNFEAVDIQTPLAVVNPGQQSNRKGATITPLAIHTTGGSGVKAFSATGLPPGLSIDSQAGIISGTIGASASTTADYIVTVSVHDNSGTPTTQFHWTVLAPLTVSNSNDDGAGSLRQAIVSANGSSATTNAITFALPSGSQTINLLTPLPAIAGQLAAILDATQHVTILGSSFTFSGITQAFTLSGVGSLTLGGGIDGAGNVVVNTGGDLTAIHIVAGALVIGGTAGSPAIVTIAASDANGNPLNSMTASTMSTATAATASFTQPAPATADSQWAVATPSTMISTTASSVPQMTVVDSSISDTTASGERQPVIAANKNGELLHRDAAAFADADVLEWAASTPATRLSTAGEEISLLADDLLDAIGRQWQN